MHAREAAIWSWSKASSSHHQQLAKLIFLPVLQRWCKRHACTKLNVSRRRKHRWFAGSAHDCSANRNNLFNGVTIILQWVVFFYHHLAHVYEIWWQWSIHNMMLWTTNARHTPSLSAELAVGVERKIQSPLLSLPFMNVTETILTLHKNQFFLCC